MSAEAGQLDSLRAELTAFAGALDDEAAALAAPGQAGLAEAVAVKTQRAESVAERWRHTAAWLRAQGIPPGTMPAALQAGWSEILSLAARVKSLNERNAHLIEAQMLRTRAALDVLQSAARPVNLYGSDGYLDPGAGLGHSLDKA